MQLVTFISSQWLSSLFLDVLTDVHDVLRELCVDHSLAKEMFPDVQIWSVFSYL